MSYHLEGRLLEVCNCKVLCPCRIGEDPDFKACGGAPCGMNRCRGHRCRPPG